MTYKITVFLNRVQCQLDPSYFSKHGVNIVFTYKNCDIHGYSSELSQNVNTGGYVYMLQGAEKYVSDPDADAIAFMVDQNEWANLPGSQFPLRPNAPTGNTIIYNNKPFTNMPVWNGGVESYPHEIMHCLRISANLAGFPIKDVMDTYTDNANPDDPNGNFAQQWALLQPYINKNMYKYFNPKTDPNMVGVSPTLMNLLDQARGIAGVPFVITSGLRTPAQNAAVGGVQDSSHETGLAVDLLVKDGISGEKINAALHQVGIKRFGYYQDGHIHCDIDYSKPNPCYWIK